MENLHKPSSSPEATTSLKLEDLIAKNALVGKAFKVASDAHLGKTRDDGTPYITHCLAVARIGYEEWGITDPEKISALLLHDTVEDTGVTPADLKRDFGTNVESWVDGLTKFEMDEGAEMTREGKEKETYKKIVERNLIDPNVGMFKLADVLHNSRTLSSARPDKRIRNAKKTLNYFAPLAESLGMWIVKTELENLTLKYAEPETYDRYSKLFDEDPRTQEVFRSSMQTRLEKALDEAVIPGFVAVRENSLVRLKDKKHPFGDINDVVSFRVVIKGKDINEKRDRCYRMLGALRENFNDIEDQSRFDDFYSSPKFNEYSAIQITLNTPLGAVEIAITSDEKEDYNNWGIISLLRKGEWQLQEHALKIVTTPTGQAKFLPPSANGLDLAYLINKKLAAQAVSITVNGEELPLSTIIPNGADVKINAGSDRIAPDRGVVEASSSSTKKKAEKQYLEQKMHDVEAKGKEVVQKVIAEAGLLDLHDLTKIAEHSDKLVNLLNYSGSKRSLAVLYRLVKYNVINENDLRGYLEKYKITKKDLGLTSILIEGKNKGDLLSFFSSKVGKLEGDIRWIEGGSANGTSYYIRMVVQNLTPNTEIKIKQMFAKNQSVSKIDVV